MFGSRTCSPPSWLKSTVTLPKSQCSPSAIVSAGTGGACVTRAVSPLVLSIWWKRGMMSGSRLSSLNSALETVIATSWHDLMNCSSSVLWAMIVDGCSKGVWLLTRRISSSAVCEYFDLNCLAGRHTRDIVELRTICRPLLIDNLVTCNLVSKVSSI